jgi:class 3 adenylate cyclase
MDAEYGSLRIVNRGVVLTFAPGRPVTVGRAPDADVQIRHNKVSRRHLEVLSADDGWTIRDLDSANGTYVDGKRVRELVLSETTEVTLGGRSGPVVVLTPVEHRRAEPRGETLSIRREIVQDAGVDGHRTLTIGRDPDSAIHVNDPTVSWNHAELHADPATGFELRDVGSRNGTFVNGRRIERSPIVESDLIAFGDRRYRLIGTDLEPLPETASAPAQRRLATVLLTDIVRSTQVAAALGDEEWQKRLAEHDAMALVSVEACGGRVIKSTGDGILAVFDRPGEALGCARDLVRKAKAVDLEIRVGLHSGEIVATPLDVHGMAVHIAARVMAQAGAGEVLTTSTVRDLVVGSGFRFDSRGEHELRGVDEPWRIYSLSG